MEMIQRDFWFMKNFERVIPTFFVFLIGIVCSGCVPVVTSALIADSAARKSSAYKYVDQTQAFRLDGGMSLEQFDQEMWDYVPEQYSQVLESRINGYVRKFSRAMKKNGASKNYIRAGLKEFPELETQYEAIQAKQFKYRNHESFWDLKSMAYRAVRLREGAPEETIIEELRQSDLFFNRRYEKYRKKLSEGSAGS
jgi:hypothetical protein